VYFTFNFDNGTVANEVSMVSGAIFLQAAITDKSANLAITEEADLLLQQSDGANRTDLTFEIPIAIANIKVPAKADDGDYILATLDDIPIINENFLGTYTTLLALQTAHPTASSGNYAIVDGGVGIDAVTYIWDDNDSDWIAGSGSSISTTDAIPEGTTNYILRVLEFYPQY